MLAKKVGIAHLFCTNEHTFKPRVCSLVQKRCAMTTFLASISKSDMETLLNKKIKKMKAAMVFYHSWCL